MSREKGKKGRKDPKPSTKKANTTPKIRRTPRVVDPEKLAKALAAQERRAAAKAAMPTEENRAAGFEDPTGRFGPFIQGPIHAKWPALFKKDLGLAEARIKSLDRMMQAMRPYLLANPEGSKARLDYELGERGNWRAICAMMDRARDNLCMAREQARGMLPAKLIEEERGTGVVGTNFERLISALDQKAAELGYDPKGKGGLGRSMESVLDNDGDSEMTDASDSDADSESEAEEGDNVGKGADFVFLNNGAKIPRLGKPTVEPVSETKPEEATTGGAPLFFVDTEPTPVNISAVSGKVVSNSQMKKERKIQFGAARAEKKANRVNAQSDRLAGRAGKKADFETKTEEEPKAAALPEVDLAALEASLKADVEAAKQAQAEARDTAEREKKAKMKRRRTSDGVEQEVEGKRGETVKEKKIKKIKKEKVEDKKRKVDESESAGDVEGEGGVKKQKRKHTVDA